MRPVAFRPPLTVRWLFPSYDYIKANNMLSVKKPNEVLFHYLNAAKISNLSSLVVYAYKSLTDDFAG